MKKPAMRLKILISAVLFLVVAGAAFLHGSLSMAGNELRTAAKPQVEPLRKDEVVIRTQDGEDLFFTVELALTPQQQSEGLMYRTSMQDDTGMLFVFNAPSSVAFWMKNTFIPLDMLFLEHDGIIHHIHHNAKPQDLTRITAELPSKAVLEINGGLADKYGIKEGDQVLHAFFGNGRLKN